MNERWYRVANLAFLMLATVVSLNLQTVLWFHTVGDYTSPSLWILTLTYLTLRRTWTEAILGIYLLAFVVASHSLVNWGWLFLVCFAVYATINMIRNRLYFESTLYFTAMGGGSVLLFNLYHLLLTAFHGSGPVQRPDILRWIAQSLTTAGLAPLLFVIFEKIDEYTRRGLLNESVDLENL